MPARMCERVDDRVSKSLRVFVALPRPAHTRMQVHIYTRVHTWTRVHTYDEAVRFLRAVGAAALAREAERSSAEPLGTGDCRLCFEEHALSGPPPVYVPSLRNLRLPSDFQIGSAADRPDGDFFARHTRSVRRCCSRDTGFGEASLASSRRPLCPPCPLPPVPPLLRPIREYCCVVSEDPRTDKYAPASVVQTGHIIVRILADDIRKSMAKKTLVSHV